jgi:CheY-like chemotaxis protein
LKIPVGIDSGSIERKRNSRFGNLTSLSTGSDAIKFFRREAPYDDRVQFPDADVVFLDLKMPGIDGFSVLKFLRENVPERAMALPTAAGILALSAGTLLARPERLPVALLGAPNAGGYLARWLLPAAVVLGFS